MVTIHFSTNGCWAPTEAHTLCKCSVHRGQQSSHQPSISDFPQRAGDEREHIGNEEIKFWKCYKESYPSISGTKKWGVCCIRLVIREGLSEAAMIILRHERWKGTSQVAHWLEHQPVEWSRSITSVSGSIPSSSGDVYGKQLIVVSLSHTLMFLSLPSFYSL